MLVSKKCRAVELQGFRSHAQIGLLLQGLSGLCIEKSKNPAISRSRGYRGFK